MALYRVEVWWFRGCPGRSLVVSGVTGWNSRGFGGSRLEVSWFLGVSRCKSRGFGGVRMEVWWFRGCPGGSN
jgi:hypothetical protein